MRTAARLFRYSTVAALAAGAVLLLQSTSRPDPLPGFPRIMLWAWERPEDLRFVKPSSAGIAFLARTIWLDHGKVASRPRLQPLRFQPGTALMAVIRFESEGHGLPPRGDVIGEVLKAAAIPGVRALQIDFDARESERAWYGSFLRELQHALPRDLPLTITALASWCEQDGWIRDLPVADASPMLFRMGPSERRPVVDFPVPLCRWSVGVATDELPVRVPPGRRLFFFHTRPWTSQAYEAMVAQTGRWQ
jgi:hypothetical protein